MLIYVFFYFCVLSTFFLERRYVQFRNLLIFVLFFLFSAFRFNVGTDYASYYIGIYDYIFLNDTLVVDRFESFSRLLIDIAYLFQEPQVFFIISSFIIIYLIFTTLFRYSSSVFISIFLWLGLPFLFFSSLGLIRQYLAIAVVFYSYKYILERSSLKFLICVFIAFLFHKSALIALPFYFFSQLKIKSIYWFMFLFMSFFLKTFFLSTIELLFPVFSHYIQTGFMPGGRFLIYLYIVIYMVLLFFNSFLKKEHIPAYNFVMFGLLIHIVAYLVFGNLTIARMGLYGIMFLLLLIPIIVHFFEHHSQIFVKCFVVSSCFVMMMLTLYLVSIGDHRQSYTPYQVFWNQTIHDLR